MGDALSLPPQLISVSLDGFATMNAQSATTFLALFGSPRVEFTRATPEYLFGHIAWPDDPAAVQEIAVDQRQPPLTPDALAVAEFLRSRGLVASDRLKVTRESLREIFFSAVGASWTLDRFDAAYDALLRFRVSMVDDGTMTDSFFLHE